MPSIIIVRYGELALKSEPVRRRFEQGLVKSMKRVLGSLKYIIWTERGRIFVETSSAATAIKRLAKVPGITSLSLSTRVEANMNAINLYAVKMARKLLKQGMSFAVKTNRTGDHSFTSKDVNAEVGTAVLSAVKGLRVDLAEPEVRISVEIRGDNAYMFSSTVSGIGGLPVGTQGKVMSIFSGARNDFAAAFMMIKRGCTLFPIFLNPEDGMENQKIKRTVLSAKKLVEFDSAPAIWVFPFKRISNIIKEKFPKELEFYILRRCALRAAESIAKRVGAEAIVLGDDARMITALGLPDISFIDSVCKMAVLRPLAGLDDASIKQLVEKAGLGSATGPFLKYHSNIAVFENIQNLEREINIEGIIDDDSKRAKSIRLVNT